LFFLGEVHNGYSFSNTIIVADRGIPNTFWYQCWLVHIDHASRLFQLTDDQITYSIFSGEEVYSSTMGPIFISQYNLSECTWIDLILKHPELVYDGVTCTRVYNSFGQGYVGPRVANLTLDDFLTFIC
jgi:hypothetical protein